MTTPKLLKIAAMLILVVSTGLVGCEGDAGPEGPAGPAGPEGPQGPAGEDALNTCSDCHNDDTVLMAIQRQFQQSSHNETVYWPRESGTCATCHNHNGFTEVVVNGGTLPDGGFDDTVPINCRTCHEVHNDFDGDDYALTTTAPVDLFTGGTYDNGSGNLCSNCHQARPVDPLPELGGAQFEVTSFRYGPHYAPQGNIATGNALFEFTGSASYPASNPHGASCNTCHMVEATAEYGPDVYVTGGHTWALAWDDEGEDVEAVEACTQCHGSATSFDAFNGQTTVSGLMDQLATLLVDEGILQLDTKYANEATYDPEVVAAFLNYKYVWHDGSLGVHNPGYVQALLTNTIEAMEARLPAK